MGEGWGGKSFERIICIESEFLSVAWELGGRLEMLRAGKLPGSLENLRYSRFIY